MTATDLAVVEGTPVRLATPEEAEARRDSIRRTLELAVDQLVTAWQARDYEALGYGRGQAGWDAYLDDSYGDLRHLRLPIEARRDRLVLMHGAGMSVRAAASTPGMGSKSQTADDLKVLREAGRIVDTGAVVGIDGKRQRTTPAPTPPAPNLELNLEQQRAPAAPVLTTAQQAAKVLTKRPGTTLDVMRRLRWRQGPASAAVARAAKARLIVPTGAYADGFTIYGPPPLVLEARRP